MTFSKAFLIQYEISEAKKSWSRTCLSLNGIVQSVFWPERLQLFMLTSIWVIYCLLNITVYACRQKIFRVLIFVACVICKKYLIHTLCFLLPNTLTTLKNSTNLETQNTILGSRELHNNEGKLREMVSFWETRQMTYWRYSWYTKIFCDRSQKTPVLKRFFSQ